MSERRQLSLNFFIYPDGHHEAAWRHRASAADRILDVTYYQELAQRAEAHKFDAVFFADGPALADNVRYAQRFRLEPITLLTAIASATRRIGLIATASTTYTEPYNLARLFASLDHISGGRAGWNIVTTSTPQAAQNFGLPEHPPHGERYERAREYLDVITRLWDSWEDDALVNDPRSGVFADTSKIHTIDHVGKHFRVRGPLNISRTPQGRPVYVQAGSSDDGALSRRASPKRSSRRIRRLPARRSSMPTSSVRPKPSTAILTRSRFCRASARLSRARRSKPIGCRTSSTN